MRTSHFLPTPSSLLVSPGEPFLHRDLSWLQFNERVLAEARDHSNPLLERAKFLSITSSNLDEFFMIRYASIGRQVRSLSRLDPGLAEGHSRIRDEILARAGALITRQAETFDLLSSELESEGIWIERGARPGEEAFDVGKELFSELILPALAPPEAWSRIAMEAAENLSVRAFFPGDLWIQIPKTLPGAYVRTSPKDQRVRIFFLDDLLLSHLADAFRLPGTPGLLRVSRDGDFTVDLEHEDPETIPELIRRNLSSRDRGRVVRVQYAGDVSEALLKKTLLTYRLIQTQFFPPAGSLYLHSLWGASGSLPEEVRTRTKLSYPPLQAFVSAPFRKEDIGREDLFAQVKARDFLFHHPYDSFEAFVHWIENACRDPNVVMIEQTVYRMDAFSPVIDALKSVAQSKKVKVIIELRARFDELNNLRLADDLRKSGVEVAFGFGSLKLHAKVALITRKETTESGEEKFVRYTHLSTGNYNATTARQYEDLAILTAHPEFGEDARQFFDAIWNRQIPDATQQTEIKIPTRFRQLVPAPTRLYSKLVKQIQEEREAARGGNKKARIFAKVNALIDHQLIEALYEASQDGVKIDLVVRGACALIPGVKGMSENIRVLSVVDRFLEHSRIYYFGSTGVVYLSSADWMQRNLFSRLELAFPVLDPKLKRLFTEILIPSILGDTVRARELTAQGNWKKRPTKAHPLLGKPMRCQFYFTDVSTASLVASLKDEGEPPV